MKTNYFILTGALLFGAVSYAQTEKNEPHFLEKNLEWDTIRPLTEINNDEKTDSYPWLSADGLRIYMTKSDPQNIYFSSRPDLNSAFSPPVILASDIPDGAVSCWLTDDELEIFYSNQMGIFHASRLNTSDNFGNSYPISIQIPQSTFISGPSLTADKDQMIVFSSDSNADRSIFIMDRVDSATYAISQELMAPPGLNFNPGQLSKDGLHFYVGISDQFNISELYRMERADVNSPFGDPVILGPTINDPNFNRHNQPSVSGDEQIIVWVNNEDNTWDGNELYIANTWQAEVSKIEKEAPSHFLIYPNPSTGVLNVDFGAVQEARIEIYSMLGAMLLNRAISPNDGPLDLSHLKGGVYLIRLHHTKGMEQFSWVKQ